MYTFPPRSPRAYTGNEFTPLSFPNKKPSGFHPSLPSFFVNRIPVRKLYAALQKSHRNRGSTFPVSSLGDRISALGNGILQLAQEDEKQYVCVPILTMDTAPVGLVFLSINPGTLVSMSLTMFCSLGKELVEGMDVWTQLLLLLLALPPPMDLGLLSLLLFLIVPPAPTSSRPFPLLANKRVSEDVERNNDDVVVGAKPVAAGTLRRKRNAAGRFMIGE